MSQAGEKPVRVERTFHPDGSPKEEIHCRGESSHGAWRQWHPNGVLAREWRYDRHVLADGVHRTWHDNGQLESVLTVRDARPIEEVCYNRSGKRVPSVRDRMLAEERAFLERAAAKARKALSPQRRKRMLPDEAERHRALIEELLVTRSAPALSWLREATEASSRGLGELDHAASLFLVETLHDLGAREVVAVRIEGDEHDPAQTTNYLVVALPADAAARARVIAFERGLARRQGFTGEGDWGQEQLFLSLC